MHPLKKIVIFTEGGGGWLKRLTTFAVYQLDLEILPDRLEKIGSFKSGGGNILNELHSRINSNPVQIFLSDLKPVGKHVRFKTFCLSLFNSKVHFIILKPVLDSSAAATKSQIIQLNSSETAHSPHQFKKNCDFQLLLAGGAPPLNAQIFS